MRNTPQANLVNPAVGNACKTIVMLPGIGSTHVNYNNTALDLNEIFKSDSNSDSLLIDFDNIIKQSHNKEVINAEVHIPWIYIGHQVRNTYYTFAVTEKMNSYNVVSEPMLRMFWYGNTPVRGEDFDYSGTRVNLNHYREFSFGASRDLDDRLRIGGKVKLLQGLANAYTPRFKASLSTDSKTFALHNSLDGLVRVNMPLNYVMDSVGKIKKLELRDDFNALSYLLEYRNMGAALDFGFIYQYDDQWTFSGSLLDVGAIYWTSEAMALVSKGEMTYKGYDGTTNFRGDGNVSGVVDSLLKVFWFEPEEGNYVSTLAPDLYLGATYTMDERWNAGALLHSQIYRNRLRMSLTLSANARLKKNLSGSVSYSIQNGEFNNLGAGVSYKLGHFQFHAVSDNIPGLFYWDKTQNVNLRMGVSLVFGCPGDPTKQDRILQTRQDPYDEYIDVKQEQKRQQPKYKRKNQKYFNR